MSFASHRPIVRAVLVVICTVVASAFTWAATLEVTPAAADGVALAIERRDHLPSAQTDADGQPVLSTGGVRVLRDALGGPTLLVESIAVTGDTPTATDNDFTRIDQAIQAVALLGDGAIVRLVGTFDWSEPNAQASWAAADYAVIAPVGVADVTIHATARGEATVIGRGEQDDAVYYEGFLAMYGGTYQGWTIENLVLTGFEWTIGLFFAPGSGSTEDFNGVTIRNNRIEIPSDAPGNSGAGTGEPYQNVGIHLGFGENQTIEGNEIVVPGDGVSDTTTDPANPQIAATVVLQSNTSGGNVFDGLRIVDNTVRITGMQSADPERVYGIWENGHAHSSDIEVSGNAFVNEHAGNDPSLNFQRGFRVTSHSSATTTVTYADNYVSGATIGINWLDYSQPVAPPATVEPVQVVGNTLVGNGTGIRVHTDDLALDDGVPTKMSKAVLRSNRIVGNAVGVRSQDAEVTAEGNWWGCNEGPGASGCDTASYAGTEGFLDADPWLVLALDVSPKVVDLPSTATATATVRTDSDGGDLGAIPFPETDIGFSATRGSVTSPEVAIDGLASSTFSSTDTGIATVTAVLDNGSVSDEILVTSGGVVTVQPIADTGDTPNLYDNDYTRLNDLVQKVGDGVTIHLDGTFDWTEHFAALSWSRGSDGVAGNGDDYVISAPGGFSDVTISAALPGGGVVLGPGDLPGVNLEGFLGMWSGSYQGWTVSNLDLRGFDLPIGMFYSTTTDFNDVTISDNRFELPADLNAADAPDDPNQNIALHFSFGTNQTIAGNEFVLPGDGTSDTDSGKKAASVVMQSHTSGGSVYDGLRIVDNLIRITGAQTGDPEWIYGIWENAHAHSSNIEVSGNSFINEHPGNDPALNRQRAFRVTSHSSATTTVTYAGNTVSGANIGIHWIGDNYTSAPSASVLPVQVLGNTLLDNSTGVWVHTDNLAMSGGVPTKMSKALLRFNRIAGNAVGVRSDDAEVDAEDNWWGCNAGPGSVGCDTAVYAGTEGFLDADPWLVLGLSLADSSLPIGSNTTATADVRFNSDAVDTSGAGALPDGTPVEFGTDGGSMSPESTGTVAGLAASMFTAGSVGGTFEVSTMVDSETVTVSVDLDATVDLWVQAVPATQHVADGGTAAATFTFANDGPAPADGTSISIAFPIELTAVAWTCTASGGATCPAASGVGDVVGLVDLPAGAGLTFAVSGTVPTPFSGELEIVGGTVPPGNVEDPDAGDNVAVAAIRGPELFSDGFESGDLGAWSDSMGSVP